MRRERLSVANPELQNQTIIRREQGDTAARSADSNLPLGISLARGDGCRLARRGTPLVRESQLRGELEQAMPRHSRRDASLRMISTASEMNTPSRTTSSSSSIAAGPRRVVASATGATVPTAPLKQEELPADHQSQEASPKSSDRRIP